MEAERQLREEAVEEVQGRIEAEMFQPEERRQRVEQAEMQKQEERQQHEERRQEW